MDRIAREAGVSRSTVSRALKGNLRLKAETRARIRRLADAMGYRPDPLLSALTSYRARASQRNGMTLAFVTHDGIHDHSGTPSMRGVRKRSEEIGYRVEEFPLGEYGNVERLNQVLWSRGVAGVVVAYNPYEFDVETLSMDRFPVVFCGNDRLPQNVHSVGTNSFTAMELAYRKIRQAGLERVGNILCGFYMEGDRERDAAVRHFRRLCGSRTGQIPILHCRLRGEPEAEERELLLRWFEKFRPEVIVGLFSRFCYRLMDSGVRIPGDVRFISLTGTQQQQDDGIAGVAMPLVEMGMASVDLLHVMIQQYQRGQPVYRQTILVEPQWCPGSSFPEPEAVPVRFPPAPPRHWAERQGIEIRDEELVEDIAVRRKTHSSGARRTPRMRE